MKEVRLIDANALLEQVENEIHRYWNEGGGGYYLAEDAIPDIQNAPTIDPESLRPHGKWVWNKCYSFDYKNLVCSNCGKEDYYDECYGYYHGNYCPNCGAKMDGEE